MRRLLLAAFAVLLVACGGDKTTTGPDPVLGTYTLRTVNGLNLPATYYQDPVEKDDFFAGDFTLAADHSWTGSLSVHAIDLTSGGDLFNGPIRVGGAYSLNNGAITLADGKNRLSLTGTVTNGTLSVGVDLGDVRTTSLVFSK